MTQAREWYVSDRDYALLAKQKYLGAEWNSYYQVMTYYYAFPDNSLAVIEVDEDGDTYEYYIDTIKYLDREHIELNQNIKSVLCLESI